METLNELLIQKIGAKQSKIKKYKYDITGLKFSKLRDVLIERGKISYEDLDNQIYIAKINGGWFKKNPAYLAIHLDEKFIEIAAYSHEGFLNQHTSEGVVNEIKKEIEKYIREN